MLKLSDAHIEKLEAVVKAGHYPDVETALEAAIFMLKAESYDYQETPEEVAELERCIREMREGVNIVEFESVAEMMAEVRARSIRMRKAASDLADNDEASDYHESPEEIALIRRRFEDMKAGRNTTRYESVDEMMDCIEAGWKERRAKMKPVRS